MSEDKEKEGDKPNREDISSLPTFSHTGPVLQLGTQIGCYKLLSVLGEGGCGIVYRAEQKKPVRRQVALKVIKPGMDSMQVIGRFAATDQENCMSIHQYQ